MSGWSNIQLYVTSGTQTRIVTVFTKANGAASVRRSMFTSPSDAYKKSVSESVVDRDADHIDQNYIDAICINYVKDDKADPRRKMFDQDDCDEIPSGVKITVSLV